MSARVSGPGFALCLAASALWSNRAQAQPAQAPVLPPAAGTAPPATSAAPPATTAAPPVTSPAPPAAATVPAAVPAAPALDTLDESVPVTAPETPPSTPTPVIRLVTRAPDVRSVLPIRAQRRLALLGELGWNGIAGFGPNLVFNAHPHLAFDLGMGLSLMGWKVGLRARYNLLTGPVTPFLGVGAMAAGGLGDSPIPFNDQTNTADRMRPTLNIKVLPSGWAQTVAGVDWTSRRGFMLLGTVGYAFLLSHDPVQVTSGTPNADDQRAFDIAFRSNLVVTLALGYAFK